MSISGSFWVKRGVVVDCVTEGQKKIKLVRFGVLEKMDWSVRCVSLQELTKENNEKTVLIEQNKLMELKKKVSPIRNYFLEIIKSLCSDIAERS